VFTDDLGSAPEDFSPFDAAPDDVAFLQYTSGSTTAPRGVRVTHRSLLANIAMMTEAFELSQASVCCSWLPPFHDMGLIGMILTPLATGFRTVQMAPDAFLRRPERWLKAITRYRATWTAAPNFAYGLCIRRVTELGGLDLSSLTTAVNAAEPVQERTLVEFEQKFGDCGLNPRSLWIGYGLAEATLMVTCRPGGSEAALSVDPDELAEGRLVPTDASRGRPLVSCGTPPARTSVMICDPESGEPVGDGVVGEIRVSGPHICDGYWENPQLTAELFPDGTLRTGDLGALWDGELYVTGRLKDLLIIRGRNHYPQDIEQTMEIADPDLRRGCGVAVSVPTDSGELLVLIQELKRNSDADPQQIVEKIRRTVIEQHGVNPDAIVLVQPASVPKTTSGKLRRASAGEAFRTGTLNIIHQWTTSAAIA
jgi:acyl-CoA synthetase (AMP-forming)/AMP-acid ligase II